VIDDFSVVESFWFWGLGVSGQHHGYALARVPRGGEKGMKMSVVGSVILTVGAALASWPASAFLLMHFADVQNTGALAAGSFFALLAVIMWGSAGWGWVKTFRAGRF
jgi:hypothetical protein